MSGIVFESYVAPSDASGLIPRLRGRASGASFNNTAAGYIPLLAGTAAGIVAYPATASGKVPLLRGVASAAGAARALGTVPKLTGYAQGGSSDSFNPGANMAFGGIPLLTSSANGIVFYPVTAIGKVPLLRGAAYAQGTGHARGFIPALQGVAYQAPTFDSFLLMVQSAGAMQIEALEAPVMSLVETLTMAAGLDVAWIQVLQDTVRITSTPSALLDALATLGEALTFKDTVGIAYAMLVQDSVAIGATPTASLRHAIQLADALTLVSGVGGALDAQVTVATAFALADSLASVYPHALAENVDLSGTVAATLRATLKLLDAMRVQDGVTPGVTWLVQTDEAFELTDANATTATLGMLLAEGIEMLGELRFDDGAYLAWVVNTETRAFVKYRNFPFNSFAQIGNRYFGCSGDGIYELAGDDDAGEPINAVVRGGLTDLGSSLLKRQPAAYIGYRAGDQMVLKVTVMAVQPSSDIERQEHWYRMEPRQANAIRENRVKLGRGLKSTYWGWELTNIDGADFDVDSFSWYPIVLERRLN